MLENPWPQVVAAKAQVFAALTVRATLEADPAQPRAEELRAGSARWLRNVGAWELAVEPLEERILGAPLGGLSSGESIDCRWASEDLAVLAWALRLGERPREWEPVDATPLLRAVRFMQPDGVTFHEQAALREGAQLRAYFKRLSLVRWASHEARLLSSGRDPASLAGLVEVLRERLDQAGIELAEADLAEGRAEVARIGPAGLSGESMLPGLLVVRQAAAEWLVAGRAAFWDEERRGD